MHIARKVWPAIISLALLIWLLWRVHPARLIAATAELDWPLLLAATILLVLTLYFWESLCFRELFGLTDQPVTYGQMLHVRGISYLAGVVNYEAGQGMAAWHVAKLQQTSLLSALSRTVLLAHHDLIVLFGLAGVGATLSTESQAVAMRPYCWIGLAVLVAAALTAALLSGHWQTKLRESRWGAWLDSWSWRRSIRLIAVRIVYFTIFIAYATIALRLAGLPLELVSVVGTVPLVLLADALPSASGLGTRDTALQLLLHAERPDTLLAMSLIWSSGLLMGRFCIGLIHLWWTRGDISVAEQGTPEPASTAAES